jgi:signal transduction histidine kinase
VRQEADATQLATLRMIFNTETGDVQREQMNIREIGTRFSGNGKACRELSNQYLGADIVSLPDCRRNDSLAREQLIDLSDKGKTFNDSAINLYYLTQKPAYERYQQSIEMLSERVNQQIRLELSTADQFVSHSSAMVNTLLAGSFLIMVLGGTLLLRHHGKFLRVQADLAAERQERQAEITRRVISAQEQERNGLGRELHDNVNQLLSAARLTLSVARDQPGQRDTLIPKSIECLHRAVEEIRCLCRSLVNPVSNDLTLEASLQELIASMKQAAPSILWTAEVSVAGEAALSSGLKLAVYRMVQEQFTNIIRHAQASTAHVQVTLQVAKLLIQVRDNGKGFDPQAQPSGLGLHNIANRAAAFHGTANLVTAPGRGCCWTVQLPLAPSKSGWKTPSFLSMAALW